MSEPRDFRSEQTRGGGRPGPESTIEQDGIRVLRGLAMDMPRIANSGHPGTAMALAPLAHVLWTRIMRYDATDPTWPDRDRFVLSCGHAAVLLYSMLYLTGYGFDLDDLKRSRQLGSKTPGHPEINQRKGIEVTTGPLGQGLANALGMALGERSLRARYGSDLVDHFTFVVCSDGDIMEGISHEAASLAGHLGLGRLICIYDDNRVTIDGPTSLTLDDDTAARFGAYGWHTEELGEIANNVDEIERALRAAMAVEDRPSLLLLRSHIGWPAPHLTDSPKAHGAPFDPAEIAATKRILGLPADESFWVPDEVVEYYRSAGRRGNELRVAWLERCNSLVGSSGPSHAEWDALLGSWPLSGFEDRLPRWTGPGEQVATRTAFKACLNAVAPMVPALVSGAADLTESTGVLIEGAAVQSKERPEGRQLAFGIREHAMGGAMNGMALHGGVLPVGGTYLVFSDYMRPAVRLAALSNAKVIYIWTHDSVGAGEDGPTHQPVEQLASLRAIPNLLVIRPADANETAQALRIALTHNGPSALILSRQAVPVLQATDEKAVLLERGAYIIHEENRGTPPDLVIVGTGSEVSICIEAAQLLRQDNIAVRVISMPCWELFEEQGTLYRTGLFGSGTPVLAVEAGASLGWQRYADCSVSLDQFGRTGPGSDVLAAFGFTATNVAERARELVLARRAEMG